MQLQFLGSESELKGQIWKSAYDGFGKASRVLRLPRRKNIQRIPKAAFGECFLNGGGRN